jgi:autotransporter-associated beta strand protein
VQKSRRIGAVLLAAAALLCGPRAASALNIVPGFDSSIVEAPNAADIENSIDTATAEIGSLIANPGTVKILFMYTAPTNANFLGESFNQTIPISYDTYVGHLVQDSVARPENTVLATAVDNLGSGNDANGAKAVEASTAQLRVALGDRAATPCFDASGNFVDACNATYDGVIVLNNSGVLDFTRPIPAYDNATNNVLYDAVETEEHEIDEILGIGGWGTTLGGGTQGVDYGPLDLYRYRAPGHPSYTGSGRASSYFSVDGGVTDLVGFSQLTDGADYSDWGPDFTPCPGGGFGGPGYVQDTDSCNNKQSDVYSFTPEFAALEALGYNPSAAALAPVIGWNCSTNPDPTAYSGTLNAIKVSSCTQVVTGDSTFTGGTTINTGTLQLGNGGTTGSIIGDVADSGTLAFDRSDTVVFAGTISGGGTLEQDGSGTLVLTGTNTVSGITTINSGTLQLGNGGTTGALSGNIVDDATLAFDRSDTTTYSGVISGSGAVRQRGPGTTILTGNNTYTGGTTIEAGTLQLGDGGTHGIVQGAIVDDGVLAFDRSGTTVFKGLISGTGVLLQMGPGTTVLTASDSYTGGTVIAGGVLQIGNGKAFGAIIGNVADNAVLTFDRPDAIAFAGAVSGSGAVDQIGTGTLTLTGPSSYSGGTNVLAGTLEAGSNGALGTGAVALNGASATLLLDNGITLANPVAIQQAAFIDVNNSDVATLAGQLSGSAPFEKDGTGTLVFASDNRATYSGDIAFHGTLSVGVTGGLGTGTVTVLGSNIVLADGVTYGNPTVLTDDLTVEQDGGAAAITGPISQTGGPWGLTKTGPGALTLANANSFTGQTIVANGLLVVSGTLSGSAVVESGASIAVTGVVAGGVTIEAGGSLAPAALGPGFATATLATYSESGGTLSIRFGGVSSGFASDALVVPGTVTLSGGTLDPHPAAPAADFLFDQRYIVIAASGPVTGTFGNPAGFATNAYDSALLQRVLYNSSGVAMEIRRPLDFAAGATSANRRAVGGALNLTEANPGDAWTGVLNAFSALPAANVGAALDQVSGEGLLDAVEIAGDGVNVFNDALRTHLVDITTSASDRTATLGDGNRLWIATLGRDAWASAHDGYAGTHTQVGEFAFGADTTLANGMAVGIAGATGSPDQNIAARATAIAGKLDAYGAYGRVDLGEVYLAVTLGHDETRLTEHRSIRFGSIADAFAGAFHQQATEGAIELDWRLSAFDGEFEPLLRLSYLAQVQGGFMENANGASGLGLTLAHMSNATLTETLGAGWRRTLQDGDVWFTPNATAALSLDSVDDIPTAAATFEGAPPGTGSFAATGQHAAPFAADLGAGVTMGMDGTPLVLRLNYEGRFADRATSHSAVLSLSYAW